MSPLLTDLQSRLLPDAGGPVQTFAGAVRHLERAYLDGVWEVLLAPRLDVGNHSTSNLRDVVRQNRGLLDQLRSWCGIPALKPGHLLGIRDTTDVNRIVRVPELGLAGTRWLLVEFGDRRNRAIRPVQTIRELRRAGFQVLVAHAEKYSVRHDPHPLIEVRRWTDAGAALQIDAGSLLGLNGPESAHLAWRLIDEDLGHVLASGDSVAVSRISTSADPLRAAAARVAFRWSPAEALRLAAENPRRILRNVHRADLQRRASDRRKAS